MLDTKALAWAKALDPAHIAQASSPRHVQSVIEVLVAVVCRRSAEIERLAQQREALRAQPVKPLTDEQISEIEGWFSNEFGLEAKHSTDFARTIETECAAAWGVKLDGEPLPSVGGPHRR